MTKGGRKVRQPLRDGRRHRFAVHRRGARQRFVGRRRRRAVEERHLRRLGRRHLQEFDAGDVRRLGPALGPASPHHHHPAAVTPASFRYNSSMKSVK